MTDWTRILRTSELPGLTVPSPSAELAGAAKRYPQRFFSKAEQRTQGEGLALRRGILVVAREGAGSDIPIGRPPPEAFLTPDRMWRPGERKVLEHAASSILHAHEFPVGYDPYGEITWNRRDGDLWWSIQSPEVGVEIGVQVYCLDLFNMPDLWPAWSPFEWAWRIYYSNVLCMNGRASGMSEDWAAGFGLGLYLAEFELNRRFDLPLTQAQPALEMKGKVVRGARKGGEVTGTLQSEAAANSRNQLAAWLNRVLAQEYKDRGQGVSRPDLAIKVHADGPPGWKGKPLSTIESALKVLEIEKLIDRPAPPKGRRPRSVK